MEDEFSLPRELKRILANQLVREGSSLGRSPWTWGVLSAVAILMAWLLHPVFIVPAVIASLLFLLWLAGHRQYRQWRRQLVVSACRNCATPTGPETSASAFAEREREFRDYMAKISEFVFIGHPPVESIRFLCPSCSTRLCFSCCSPGELNLEDDDGEDELEIPGDLG